MKTGLAFGLVGLIFAMVGFLSNNLIAEQRTNIYMFSFVLFGVGVFYVLREVMAKKASQ